MPGTGSSSALGLRGPRKTEKRGETRRGKNTLCRTDGTTVSLALAESGSSDQVDRPREIEKWLPRGGVQWSFQ